VSAHFAESGCGGKDGEVGLRFTNRPPQQRRGKRVGRMSEASSATPYPRSAASNASGGWQLKV